MIRRLLALVALALALPIPAHAAGRPSLADGRQFRRFMAAAMRHDLAAYHVPGIVFVAVHGERIVDSAGVGYADLARHRPMRPGRTVIELGAVSAILTTICVLQLAEQGRVGLHRGVNRYLTGFRVRALDRRPITLASLLTNTAGIASRHIGRRTLDRHGVHRLGAYLAAQLPPQLRPAGAAYSYSAFSFGLAGAVVQDVARRPFARYAAAHLFGPLRMRHSSARQPTPPPLLRAMATGYDVAGGSPRAAPPEYFNLAPAEGMVATADDMARLLRALLSGGAPILHRRTVRLLEAKHFSSYPRLRGFPPFPAIAYGFGRYEHNGRLVLEQSGTVRGFSDLLALLPAQRFGIFIAGNTARDSYLFALQRRLLDRYHPAPARPRRYPPDATARPPLGRFAGSYWSDEYAPDTIEKLRQLVNQVQVSTAGPVTLSAHFWSGGTVRARRVAPLLFQAGGGTFWAFRRGPRGVVARLIPGGNAVYDRIPWYASTTVQIAYLAILLLIFLSGIAVWVIRPLIRRRGPDLSGLLGAAVCALNVLFLVLLGVALWSAVSTQAEHYSWLEYGAPPAVYALLCLPLLSAALTPILAAVSIAGWWRGRGSAWARSYHSVVALAALAFLPFLAFWNLIGFHV